MKPITLDEYKEAADEFMPKYFFVAEQLGEGAKTEDILAIMESLAGVAMRNRSDNKTTLGFNKKEDEDGAV